MSNTVDVLAELDWRLAIGEMFGQEHDIPATDLAGNAALCAARAAVAELIEAADELIAAVVEPAEPQRPLYTFRPETVTGLRAALARIGEAP